ncbi:hypothetical protein ABZP12_01415 [Xanthomonas euvesicatoria]
MAQERVAPRQRARWLKATLPRISTAATSMVQVSGSPSSDYASSAPDTGTR